MLMFMLRIFLALVYFALPAKVVRAGEFPILNIFKFGSSISDAKDAAASNGWTFEQVPESESVWAVDAGRITLYFCDNILSTIDEYYSGGFDQFVDLAFGFQRHGKPDTDIVMYPILGEFTRSVTSSIKLSDGTLVSLQLRSRKDEVRLWARMSDEKKCDNG